MDLDDGVLTESGLEVAPSGKGRILVVACGAVAREILALVRSNGWTHLDLTCLPAKLHLHPDRIPDAVSEAVTRHRERYDDIFVAYADCGTGGILQAACRELGVEMIDGPHCYSFFDGNDRFAERADEEFTAFYLTDFLVRQFDAFVWKPLGLDRHPELRDAYFGGYEKLVYQSQKEDAGLQSKARDCARRLGLEYEYRFTGYGDLETSISAFAGSDRTGAGC